MIWAPIPRVVLPDEGVVEAVAAARLESCAGTAIDSTSAPVS